MKTILTTTLLVIATLVAPSVRAADDILIADFEGPDYGNWKVTGEAFGPGPAQGTLPTQNPVDGYLGTGLVNTYFKGDGTTGTLASPPFKLQRPYLNFLIGGGGFEGQTCLNLLVNGKIMRTATGLNTEPGGSEHLDWQSWSVSEFAGQEAVIEIADAATGGWGHINVDHIVQSDRKVAGLIKDAAREITLEKRYLQLPVKNGAPMRRVGFRVPGKVQREFDIELADGVPDWWAFMDVSPFIGQRAWITVKKLREGSTGLSSIDQSDEIKGAGNLYRETLRPQFHFTSRRGWNNDANGLVFYKGEYHLFYQHNPYGCKWGNMHWGHAVSPDLVHWTELPIALYPDKYGTMFSGSAVVDRENTAGFQTGEEKVLVCIYTAAGSQLSEGLAFSNDRGRTWTKYDNNPVLSNVVGNDPKVIWYAPEKKWIMALFLTGSDYGLFTSADLKTWEKMSGISIPGTWECPEFFEIAVEGNKSDTRWILYGGNGRYLVGRFDGRKFTSESGPLPLNRGNCFYASQTFNDIPPSDGRRILIPWGTMAIPGMPFNQMMGVPVELQLRTTGDGLRLLAYPVKELQSLRTQAHTIESQPLKPGENPLAEVRAELLDITVEFAVGEAAEIGFNLRGVPVAYDVAKQQLTCQDQKAALKPVDGKIRLRLLVDRTSVDIFGNDGLLYMPVGVIVPQDNRSVVVYAKGGSAKINSLEVCELKSIWGI